MVTGFRERGTAIGKGVRNGEMVMEGGRSGDQGWWCGWGGPCVSPTLVTQTTSEYFHVMHKQVKNSLIQIQRANRKGPGGAPTAPGPPRPPAPAHGPTGGMAPPAGRGPGRAPAARGAPPEPGSGGAGGGAWSSVGGQVPGSTRCRSTGPRGERESGPRLVLERGHRSENRTG